MTYEFVQVTARNSDGSFAMCSNLSVMDYKGLTPKQALRYLQVMADEYQLNGYSVEWTREIMNDAEIKIWGPLFDRVSA